jgi:5S rRNA maturation endonuclease (ribonuclease M5)
MANSALVELCESVVGNIDLLFDYFGIEPVVYADRLSFCCPIHESDNLESASIFVTGHTKIGNWKCWTASCEEEILEDDKPRGNSLFGLVRGLLSVKLEKPVSFRDSIVFLQQLYNIESASINTKYQDVNYKEKNKFIMTSRILGLKAPDIKGTLERSEVRGNLQIPDQYFLGRGFSTEILEKYDVGYCDTYGDQMFQRATVPIYDDDHKRLIGCVGRTTKPLCTMCEFHHDFDRKCPSNEIEKRWGRKWLNTSGFRSDTFLYNYWYAKEHISKTGWAILVEGQGDVWKLEMAGYHIGLGIFGDSLGDNQKKAIDKIGAINLLILTDNDKAGLEARNKISKKCCRYYNCYYMDLPKKDLGDMDPVDIQNFLEPMLGGKL